LHRRPSTDKAHSVNDSFSSTDMWEGGQVEQGPWFYRRVQHALENFAYKLLCTAAVVSIPFKGQRLPSTRSSMPRSTWRTGWCQGTMQEPNMRMRESLPPSTTAPRATVASPAPVHGGYPGTPTPTVTAPAIQRTQRPCPAVDLGDPSQCSRRHSANTHAATLSRPS